MNMPQIKPQQGFTMMEVLVTILIVSFGLLGFAGLLTKSIQDNRTAYMRSQATVLAQSAIECMRANRSAAVAGSYTIAFGSNIGGTTPAALDVQAWKTDLGRFLPEGDGSINVDSDGNATVIVQWDDDGDGVATSFTTQTSI